MEALTYEDLIRTANPAQSATELAQLLRHIPSRRRVVLEIGVHQGGSARTWAVIWEPNVIVGVDDTDDLRDPPENFVLVQGRSQEGKTVRGVYDALAGRQPDFLFIDGGHGYEEVVLDWQNYTTFCAPGAYVGFHDAMLPEVWKAIEYAEHDAGSSAMLFHSPTDGGTGTALIQL